MISCVCCQNLQLIIRLEANASYVSCHMEFDVGVGDKA